MIDSYELPKPEWAIKATVKLQKGSQLCTKDGRRIGNACVVSDKYLHYHLELWDVITDAGTLLRLTTEEIHDFFYPPQWIMDITTAPGLLVNKTKL